MKHQQCHMVTGGNTVEPDTRDVIDLIPESKHNTLNFNSKVPLFFKNSVIGKPT